MRASRYRPSSWPGALAVPAGLAVGGITAFICAYPYQYMILGIHNEPIKVLLPAAFGLAVGWAVKSGLAWGKCQSTRAAATVALVCGLIGVVWSFHLAHIWGRVELAEQAEREWSGGPLHVDPHSENASAQYLASQASARARVHALREMSLSDYIDLRVERSWTFGTLPRFDGVIVWIVWLSEATIICGLATHVAGWLTCDPTCVRCGVKLEVKSFGRDRAISQPAMLQARRGGSIQDMLDVEIGGGDIVFVWERAQCPRCSRTTGITVRAQWNEMARPKNVTEHDEVLVDSVVPSNEELAAMEARFPAKRPPKRRVSKR